MIKGIQDWQQSSDDSGVIARAMAAQQAGFEVFELVLAKRGALTITADESSLRRLAESIRNHSLDVASVKYSLPRRQSIRSTDEQARRQMTDIIIMTLDRAAWLGARILVIDAGQLARSGNQTLKIGYADALNAVYEHLRALAYEAESRAVIIAINNPKEAFLLSPVEMRELLDRVGSPWVQACLNIGRVQWHGSPTDWITTLGPRIAQVYATDRPRRAVKPDRFCLPGDGEVNWPEVITALNQVGYQGPLTCIGPGEPAELCRRLKGILPSP